VAAKAAAVVGEVEVVGVGDDWPSTASFCSTVTPDAPGGGGGAGKTQKKDQNKRKDRVRRPDLPENMFCLPSSLFSLKTRGNRDIERAAEPFYRV